MAPPPQLSVEPKVPFLRSLAHFAFAATSLARPRGFLARHGGRPRRRCWPPSIPQKLLPQRGAARRQPGRAGIRKPERAPGEGAQGEGERERALRSRTTRPCPPIIVRVTDGGRTVDRRSKARWRVEGNVRQTRWMRGSERASERHGVMAAAPKSDARGGRESLGMEFRTAFLKGCGNSGLREPTATRPVRSVHAKKAEKAQKVRIPPRFPPVAPPSVTSPRAAASSPLRGGG